MASVQPAPLEQVLHQLVISLAELTRILSDQRRSGYAQNEQLSAQNSPETENDVEISTQVPPEVETVLCATPVAGSDLTEVVVPVKVSTNATPDGPESTTASGPPLEIVTPPSATPATNPDISKEAVPASVSSGTPPDTSENAATPAPPQLDDFNPSEDVFPVTSAPPDVSGSAIVSEVPQSGAIVRLPRDLDEWFVSPLPTGIRMKIFQAAGTSFLMSHPLFGFMTLKVDLEKAGASRSILEEFTEDPLRISFWEQYFEIAYTQYTYYVRTKFQLVELPALEGKDARGLYICVRSRIRSLCQSNFKTIRHGMRELFIPDSGTQFLSSQTDRAETPLGKVCNNEDFQRNRMVKSRVLRRSTLSIPVLASLSSWLSPASSEQIIQIISSYILPRHITTHRRSQCQTFTRPSDPTDAGRGSMRLVFSISYWVQLIHFPDIEDQQTHEEGILLCRELGSIFGPQYPTDPSDSDYTQQQARQVGPGSLTALLAASVLGGSGGSAIDLLFSIFRRINSVPLAKYSTLRQTRTTVNGKWRDIMSDERRSTVLERRSTVVTTLDEISTGSKYTTVILADDKVEQNLSPESLQETASNFAANHMHFLEAVSSATQTIRDDELNGVKESWNYVAESINVSTKKLQDRVNQQIEELKVHQESMFNATSLRETNNGMALNRSVYVLTAFTILYTPIGFMATFWALPFLNSPSDGGKPKVPDGFQESFITVPVLTYFIAFVSCLYLGSSRFRKILTQIVLGYRAYLFDLFGPVKYILDVISKFNEPFRVAIREIHRQRATVNFSPTRARTWTQNEGITGASGNTNQTQQRTEGV
ncbi:hypothetical protein CSIM01_05948 [Colletotrichum simmondsii]|uniref:Uncharacterized protein n=1 Tax=Colletotrichum simmondsii TaxID=703756 RepID=A0A135T3X1_9PEZI|nr:hypothetical protein CSIM01_05948 [Colletotrichum simmondsii]